MSQECICSCVKWRIDSNNEMMVTTTASLGGESMKLEDVYVDYLHGDKAFVY